MLYSISTPDMTADCHAFQGLYTLRMTHLRIRLESQTYFQNTNYEGQSIIINRPTTQFSSRPHTAGFRDRGNVSLRWMCGDQ
jgi:hypothetical protein